MPLGLSPRETTTAFDQLQQQPTAVIPPVSSGEIAAENIRAPGGAILTGLAGSYEALRGLGTNFGAMGGYDPETGSVVEETPEEVQRKFALESQQVANQFKPDPRRSGAGAQLLNSLGSGLTQFAVGTVLAGPLGGATAVGAGAGVETRNDIYAATGDKNLADSLALGSAMFGGIGAMLPGGVGGKLMTRVLSGSGIQLTAGIANRTMMHVGLEDAGYTDMAKQYMPLDGAAMMADGILGAAFGGVHHMFAPEATDAARVVKDAEHAEKAGPGIPVDPVSRQAGLDAIDRHIESMIRGDDTPPQTGDVHYVPDAAQDAAREAAARQVDEAATEVAGKPVEAPVEPQTPKDIVDEVTARVEAETQPAGSALGRTARMAEAQKAEGDVLSSLDPATREALAQAQSILRDNPDLKIPPLEGQEPIAANDALQRVMDDIKQSSGDEELHRVAAACFGRV